MCPSTAFHRQIHPPNSTRLPPRHRFRTRPKSDTINRLQPYIYIYTIILSSAQPPQVHCLAMGTAQHLQARPMPPRHAWPCLQVLHRCRTPGGGKWGRRAGDKAQVTNIPLVFGKAQLGQSTKSKVKLLPFHTQGNTVK